MLRAILVALSGTIYFFIGIAMMAPLRMVPVVNYNLFYMPFLAMMFCFLFYRCCTCEKESRAYVYAFFAAIFAWQLFGEMAAIPVEKGLITQYSSVNIKLLDGYFYLTGAFIVLGILRRTKSVKNSVAVFGLTFCLIWLFELYMENYSVKVPVEMMPTISYALGAVGLILSIVIILMAKRAETKERQTFLGTVLFITFFIFLNGFGVWTRPQTFYVKYEGKALDREISELKEERARIDELRAYMIETGMIKDEQ